MTLAEKLDKLADEIKKDVDSNPTFENCTVAATLLILSSSVEKSAIFKDQTDLYLFNRLSQEIALKEIRNSQIDFPLN